MYTVQGGQKVAKGMKRVLEERGISTAGRNGNWMRETRNTQTLSTKKA